MSVSKALAEGRKTPGNWSVGEILTETRIVLNLARLTLPLRWMSMVTYVSSHQVLMMLTLFMTWLTL